MKKISILKSGKNIASLTLKSRPATVHERSTKKKMDSLLKGNSLSDLLTKKGRKGKEKCIHRVLFGDI